MIGAELDSTVFGFLRPFDDTTGLLLALGGLAWGNFLQGTHSLVSLMKRIILAPYATTYLERAIYIQLNVTVPDRNILTAGRGTPSTYLLW